MGLKDFVEFQNFGWNPLTISTLATIIFSVIGAIGIWIQRRKIKSGKSVSVSFIISGTFLYISIFIYGVSEMKFAIIFNGIVRSIVHIPLLFRLKKSKGFNRKEWYLFWCFVVSIIGMILLPYKGIIMVIISHGILIPTALQPWEMWLNKNQGEVSLIMISIYAMSASFWVVYSALIPDYPVLVFSSISTVLFSIIIFLWLVFKDKPENQPSDISPL